MQSMKSVIEAIRGEIKQFWAKCFYSQEQQEAFTSYHSGKSCHVATYSSKWRGKGLQCSSSKCLRLADDFTEELLNQHEAEVKILEKYFEDHKELFEGVMKWQENWTLYLELDVSLVLGGFEGWC